MPDNKNQHYVPQFLLRNFKNSNSINSISSYILKENKLIECSSIRKQASDDYFYSKDSTLENELSCHEDMISPIIRKIVAYKELPTNASVELFQIYNFISILRARTKAFISTFSNTLKAVTGLNENTYKKYDLCKEQILQNSMYNNNVEIYREFAPNYDVYTNLQCALVINETPTKFIISDNPVVFFNKLLFSRFHSNNEGLLLDGLTVFVPISPETCLFLYDSMFYAVKQLQNRIYVQKQNDIDEINGLQYLNGFNTIFFNDSIELSYIEKLSSSNSKHILRKQGDAIIANDLPIDVIEEFNNPSLANVRHNKNANISFMKIKRLLTSISDVNDPRLRRNNEAIKKVRKRLSNQKREIQEGFSGILNGIPTKSKTPSY